MHFIHIYVKLAHLHPKRDVIHLQGSESVVKVHFKPGGPDT